MKVALYKGKDRLFDRMVQWWTRSDYSHCEAIVEEKADGSMVCWSSSCLDGGVRIKEMKLNPAKWDIVEVSADLGRVRLWFTLHQGKSYDFWGLAGCVLRCLSPSRDKWFCSSAVAAAIGYDEPWRVTPADLANLASYQTYKGGSFYGIA